MGAGAMMAMSIQPVTARALAASSRTLGTDCWICSVALERGVRCGLLVGWWVDGWGIDDAADKISISRSNMADEDE